MCRLEIVILFGLAFCFVNSVEECNNELDLDCFCYDEPRDNHEYSICVDPCLSEHLGVNYRRVGQRCIYFGNTTSNYDVARERCKSTFSGRGRMYEPRSFEESNNITKEGEKVGSMVYGGYWIGVNYIYNQRKFVFNSDGSSIPFTPIWHPSGVAQWRDPNNCVFGWFQYWNTYSCADINQMGTLCEYGE